MSSSDVVTKKYSLWGQVCPIGRDRDVTTAVRYASIKKYSEHSVEMTIRTFFLLSLHIFRTTVLVLAQVHGFERYQN
jgi:hypothetical protein